VGAEHGWWPPLIWVAGKGPQCIHSRAACATSQLRVLVASHLHFCLLQDGSHRGLREVTGCEGMIAMGVDKALLSLALVCSLSVCKSRDLPVISSLGIFTSST